MLLCARLRNLNQIQRLMVVKTFNAYKETLYRLFFKRAHSRIASVAFKQAYWAALASGSSVLVSENGDLIEIFPDGKQTFIKHLLSVIPVICG